MGVQEVTPVSPENVTGCEFMQQIQRVTYPDAILKVLDLLTHICFVFFISRIFLPWSHIRLWGNLVRLPSFPERKAKPHSPQVNILWLHPKKAQSQSRIQTFWLLGQGSFKILSHPSAASWVYVIYSKTMVDETPRRMNADFQKGRVGSDTELRNGESQAQWLPKRPMTFRYPSHRPLSIHLLSIFLAGYLSQVVLCFLNTAFLKFQLSS